MMMSPATTGNTTSITHRLDGSGAVMWPGASRGLLFYGGWIFMQTPAPSTHVAKTLSCGTLADGHPANR